MKNAIFLQDFQPLLFPLIVKRGASLVESEGGKLVVKVVVKLLPETVSIKGWHYCAICVLMHTELKVIFGPLNIFLDFWFWMFSMVPSFFVLWCKFQALENWKCLFIPFGTWVPNSVIIFERTDLFRSPWRRPSSSK